MATKRYTPRELMEMAIAEMRKSIPDPKRSDNKPNPKVGAVIATTDGELIGKSHRGELRIGDHAEFAVLERHHRGSKLDGYVIYATLEPCAVGARNHPKLSCTERIVNARLAKVYIGLIDPDPTVAGEGREFLVANNIEVAYFDKDLADIIYKENKRFFDDALIRAKDHHPKAFSPAPTILTHELQNFTTADLSEEAQQDFIDRMDLKMKIGSDGFTKYLVQLGFLHRSPKSKDVKPTGMGLLLLGRNPQVEFEQARIKFTIEQSVGDAKIKDVEGPLFLMPQKTEDILDLTFLPEINREKFHREEIVDVSMKLLRELILNAIIHRDYTLKEKQIRIVASKEKIEVWSPGQPIVGIHKFKSYDVPSISRNPKLAYIFFKAGLVEERGIGMKELKAFKDEHQLPDPSFRMDEGYFVVTIFRKKFGKKESPETTEITTEMVTGLIKDRGKVSSGEYVEVFGGSTKTASRHLNRLVDDGVLAREGEKRGTRYTLMKK